MTSARYRQIHLDFHTPPDCENIGVNFDPTEFAHTLKSAHVNAINIFSKCHHGYAYYPTQVGTIHPHLKFDLLGEQIEALHQADIRCPIYYSIIWDELAAAQNPGWVVVNKDGTVASRPPLSHIMAWTSLDYSSGYFDYVIGQVEELCSSYDVDGFWFDICWAQANYSPWGLRQMRQAKVDIEDDQAVWAYARQQQLEFFEKLSQFVYDKTNNASVFFNGTMNPAMREVTPFMTQLEIESLPTVGHWGYLHYPIMARQARTYGKDILGMTGRFHGHWGDFGGLKTVDQMQYECGTIVAAGGKISVGDQLHPSGKLDPAVYRMVGQAFEHIEALEPWLVDAKPTAEVGILATTMLDEKADLHYSHETEGIAQIFLETGIQFDIIDTQATFDDYPTLIVPNQATFGDEVVSKLKVYLENGGRLILSGTALLDSDTGEFQLEDMPVRYVAPAPTTPCYLRPDITTGEVANDYDYAFYEQAHIVEATEDAQSFGDIRQALYNRNWEHFFGHMHAPVGESLSAPIAVQNDNILYLAAPLFGAYRNHDYWVYRDIICSLLDGFLPPRLLKPEGPGWVEFALHNQNNPDRKIIHVVPYQARRSLQLTPHVDKTWYISGMQIHVKTDSQPKRVYTAPDMGTLEYTPREDYIDIALPPIKTHTVVVIE